VLDYKHDNRKIFDLFLTEVEPGGRNLYGIFEWIFRGNPGFVRSADRVRNAEGRCPRSRVQRGKAAPGSRKERRSLDFTGWL